MASENFEASLAAVLVHEGGYSDHPKDPGGRTNKGVTQRVYDAFRSRKNQPKRPVKSITDDEVKAVYREQYWDVIHGNELPAGVDYVVFDGAVNSGPKQAAKWLQRALGFTGAQVDGVIGNVTLSAAGDNLDHDALISRIIDRREAFLRALKTWPTFGKGWLRRIGDVEDRGQAWAMGSVGPEVVYIPDADHKAVIEDAKVAPPKSAGDVSIGVGGAGAAIPQAIEQLTPFKSFGIVQTLIVSLTVLGVVLLLGGAAWRWYATRKAAQLADALDPDVA